MNHFLRKYDPSKLTCLVATLSGLGAFGVAHLWEWMGAVPCILCRTERWIFLAAGLVGLLGLIMTPPIRKKLLFLDSLVWLGLSGVLFWHLGIQKRWFGMPAACKASIPEGTAEEVERILSTRPQVSCSDIPFTIMGMPHTFYMMLFALILVLLCFWGMKDRERHPFR